MRGRLVGHEASLADPRRGSGSHGDVWSFGAASDQQQFDSTYAAKYDEGSYGRVVVFHGQTRMIPHYPTSVPTLRSSPSVL